MKIPGFTAGKSLTHSGSTFVGGTGYSRAGDSVRVATVNCGLGRTCADGERCCVIGSGFWCCPSNQGCDYDNISCK
jgi:hypothetical protein